MLESREVLFAFLVAAALVSAAMTIVSNFTGARRGVAPHSAVKRSTGYFMATVLLTASAVVVRDVSLWPGAAIVILLSAVLGGARILVSRLSFRSAARGGTAHRAQSFVQTMYDELRGGRSENGGDRAQ
jgi:hypothetical protein